MPALEERRALSLGGRERYRSVRTTKCIQNVA